MGCCGGAAQYLRKHLYRDGDTERQTRQKVMLFVFMLSSCGILVFYGGRAFVQNGTFVLALFSVFYAVMIATLLVQKVVTEAYLRILVVMACLSTAYGDLMVAAAPGFYTRIWPLFVVLVDVLLVIEAPRYLTKWVVAFAVVWLAVVEFEYTTRDLGLFDLPDAVSWSSYDKRRVFCECDKPPCASNDLPIGMLSTLSAFYFVFLLDFVLTRGFADKVLAEKNKVAAAVDAAEYLAGRLADFDLEAARAYLEQHERVLPTELNISFRVLLDNLGSYRPYLPEELFEKAASSAGSASGALMGPGDELIPGVLDPYVALAFTDIRSSTALWEANADAMQEALDVHSTAMRTALAANAGYEVKTIGDAFMVAFPSAREAVVFGAAAQTALGAEIKWPEGLTRPNMDDGFGVLTVRMGIHCGEAVAQRNTLTGRYDYFGPVVNRAARVEPFGAPGAVTVTADVVEAVGGHQALDERFLVVPYAEMKTGKGLKEALELTALVPRGVLGIEASVRKIAAARAATSVPQPISGIFSDMGDSERGFAPLKRQRQLFSGARAENTCVGVVQFDCQDSGAVGQRLQALHAALVATRGQLAHVVNSVAWVSWGLFGACPQYVNESARCMLHLRDGLMDLGLDVSLGSRRPLFHAGLATGPLAAVEMAPSARGRRFVSLFGGCVSLGEALCRRAAETGAWLLVGALGEDDHAGQVGHVRHVGTWTGRAGVDVDMLELDLVALRGAAKVEAQHSKAASLIRPATPSSPATSGSVEVQSIGSSRGLPTSLSASVML